MVRETVVLPTPPLSAPTTITTGFAMNFPYAPFLIEAQSCNKRCRLFSRKTSTGSGFCPVIVGRPACPRRRNAPSLLWARTWQKQGRIQFIRRPSGLIRPMSLTGRGCAAGSASPLPLEEVELRSNSGEGLRPIERPYPLSSTLPMGKGALRCRNTLLGTLTAAPWTGGIDPRTLCRAGRCAGRFLGIAPWTVRQRWRGLAARRLLLVVRHIRRQCQPPGIVPAGEFHQRLHAGIDRR